jgi:hypothetical protein
MDLFPSLASLGSHPHWGGVGVVSPVSWLRRAFRFLLFRPHASSGERWGRRAFLFPNRFWCDLHGGSLPLWQNDGPMNEPPPKETDMFTKGYEVYS